MKRLKCFHGNHVDVALYVVITMDILTYLLHVDEWWHEHVQDGWIVFLPEIYLKRYVEAHAFWERIYVEDLHDSIPNEDTEYMVEITLVQVTVFVSAVLVKPHPLFHKVLLSERWCEVLRIHWWLYIDRLDFHHFSYVTQVGADILPLRSCGSCRSCTVK